MKKLSLMGKKEKKVWYESTDSSSTIHALSTANIPKKREPTKQGLRRINMLEKLFMRNITDLMATGDISEELLGKGIQITKVKVAQDFKMVNVMWVASGKIENDMEIEKTLKRTAGLLKHELSQLRVMGVVPFINFVKDKKATRVNEVEELLKIADYPEDHKPIMMADRLREDLELRSTLSPEVVKKIKALEAIEDEELDENPLPEMQHNVFGLNQADILKKISREKDKVRAAWEVYEGKSSCINVGQNVENLKLQSAEAEEMLRSKFKKYLESKDFNKTDRKRFKLNSINSYETAQFEDVGDEDIDFRDEDYLDEFEDDFSTTEKQ
ncbi:uncharacterized protein LOC134837955 [Culicoides brevitarsis]|uniref:uncharacterized protein LOC134837955 n=1 Tax=Culicoides brevitarsis TaxID=469753 RepID=UPI00307B761A